MAEFEGIEKVSHLRIFTHNIKIRKFMISCCVGTQFEYNLNTQDIRLYTGSVFFFWGGGRGRFLLSLCWYEPAT